MKHLSILVLGLALFALAGCKGEGKKTDLAIMEQADSLQKIISQKDNEINDMMETFNEIQEGLREINEAENLRNRSGRTAVPTTLLPEYRPLHPADTVR